MERTVSRTATLRMFGTIRKKKTTASFSQAGCTDDRQGLIPPSRIYTTVARKGVTRALR